MRDAAVRRGMLLLTPASLVVLGGHVEQLEQARQRMVEHWNQPAGRWGSSVGHSQLGWALCPPLPGGSLLRCHPREVPAMPRCMWLAAWLLGVL